jgi:hypothetical protein
MTRNQSPRSGLIQRRPQWLRFVRPKEGEVAMPVLDAKALTSDLEGMSFLRDVLRPTGETADKPRTPRELLAPRLRRSKAPAAAAAIAQLTGSPAR